MKILHAAPNTPWVIDYIIDLWGSTDIYLPAGKFDAAALPALYSEDQDVVLTYNLADRMDIVTFNIPIQYSQETVNLLIEELSLIALNQSIKSIYATCSNDHMDYMIYLQRAGFRYHHIYKDAVDHARLQNSDIPVIGRFDIPMRDEIEFQLNLQ